RSVSSRRAGHRGGRRPRRTCGARKRCRSGLRRPPGSAWMPRPRAMADRKDIDFSYTLTDKVIRLSLGDMADFSGAKYDGDFSLTLEQAQRRKHAYVTEQLGLESGQRVLDLGCGWGALLNHFRNVGAKGLGVTLSSAQLEACKRHGLDVRLQDARQ